MNEAVWLIWFMAALALIGGALPIFIKWWRDY